MEQKETSTNYLGIISIIFGIIGLIVLILNLMTINFFITDFFILLMAIIANVCGYVAKKPGDKIINKIGYFLGLIVFIALYLKFFMIGSHIF